MLHSHTKCAWASTRSLPNLFFATIGSFFFSNDFHHSSNAKLVVWLLILQSELHEFLQNKRFLSKSKFSVRKQKPSENLWVSFRKHSTYLRDHNPTLRFYLLSKAEVLISIPTCPASPKSPGTKKSKNR